MLWHRALRGLQCRYLLQCGPLHRLQGNTSFTMVLSMGCREISVLVPRAPPPPSSSLTLAFPGLCHTPLSLIPHCWGSVLPFLKYAFTEAPPASLDELSYVLQWVHCRAALDLFSQTPPQQCPSSTKTLSPTPSTVRWRERT